jgi:mannose-6-phosphate isomerase-like protein (cupin superfamily)
MERIALDNGEPGRRSLSAELGAEHVVINAYRLGPGEGLPGGIHAHGDQEEVFVVQSGTLTFETLDGEVRAPADSIVRFGPGEFQSGYNAHDEPVAVLAIGAPPDSGDIRIPADCPDCSATELQLEFGGDGQRLRCPECATEFEAEDCPRCGGESLEVHLGDGGTPVTVCQDCRSIFEAPPLGRTDV